VSGGSCWSRGRRLTAALSQRVQGEPHTRLRCFCLPHHQNSALHPFIAQLERAAGFARDDTVERKLEKFRELIAPGTRGEEESELVAELLSLPSSAAEFNLSPQRKREMLFEALLHQLEALTGTRPVLMVFEDAHWIDPTSRELLDLTFDRVPGLPVLLVVTFRPEFQHGWAGQPSVTMLALNRLSGRVRAAQRTGCLRPIPARRQFSAPKSQPLTPTATRPAVAPDVYKTARLAVPEWNETNRLNLKVKRSRFRRCRTRVRRPAGPAGSTDTVLPGSTPRFWRSGMW
jgi:hypothetical protein